jgi:hypothetical protein
MTIEDQANFDRYRRLFAEEQAAREFRFIVREASWQRRTQRTFLLTSGGGNT